MFFCNSQVLFSVFKNSTEYCVMNNSTTANFIIFLNNYPGLICCSSRFRISCTFHFRAVKNVVGTQIPLYFSFEKKRNKKMSRCDSNFIVHGLSGIYVLDAKWM
jgi:hypothetical protein